MIWKEDEEPTVGECPIPKKPKKCMLLCNDYFNDGALICSQARTHISKMKTCPVIDNFKKKHSNSGFHALKWVMEQEEKGIL